ncbi:MAG: hypothetical protein GEU81_08800 [Nitriliruptorales bacterium]|nr:hypothetical protein [Nitriliruptorales bacterium]
MQPDGDAQRDYKGEVDYFGVYCHERREVYLVPIDDVPGKAAMLRLAPPRNGQVKGIRWAQEYLLREVAPAYVA